jgi:predicted nuclease of predicted toxin-antitoxin system
VLLDSCVWTLAANEIRAAGYDVECVADEPFDPGDAEILRRCAAEGRILVTLDKDFGELVFVLGMPHGGIVRLVDMRARDHGSMIVRILDQYGEELVQGALVTAYCDRTRIRNVGDLH